jgi:twinkle protein
VTDLVTFARDTGAHIHLVAHPRKSPGHNAPEAHDIKGSGHIRDNADNVVVVWRNREKEKLLEADPKDNKAKQMPDSRVIIDKDREEGMYRDFALSFDPHTFSYSRWTNP